MAAGTAVKPMTADAAEEIAAREFASIVESHRPQIFRFLLASLTGRGFGRDADAGVFPEGAPELEALSRRFQRHDLADADRHQFAEGPLAQSASAVLAAYAGQCSWVDEASDWLPNGERSAEQQILAREQVGQVWKAVKGLEPAAANGFFAALRGRAGVERDCASYGIERGHGKSTSFAGGRQSARGAERNNDEQRNKFRRKIRAKVLTDPFERDDDPVVAGALKHFKASVDAWSEAATAGPI